MARAMKDSGIEWIGEIPENWKISKLKYLKEQKNYSIVDGPFGSAISTKDYVDNGIPLVRILNLSGVYVSFNKMVYIKQSLADTLKRSSFTVNDIIIAKTGATVGKCSINNSIEFGILSSSCIKITISYKYNTKYYFYVFNTDEFVQALINSCNGTTRDTINLTPFNNLSCTVPHLQIQQCIANHLDQKCAEIDSIIERTKATIEEYKNYRQSVITEAVTKGLDPNIEMKDSGIEWNKHIPSHWEVVNGRRLFALRKEKALPNDRQLTSSQKYGIIYQDDFMQLENQKVVTVQKDFDILKHVEPNDFVISMRSFQGGLEFSHLSGCISSAYVMLIPNEKVYCPYFRWLFKSIKYINALQSTSNLVRDGQAMRYSNFVQVPLFQIPIEEQKQIADYLDYKCMQIDNLISQKQQLITELESYKKSLIYECVTGKVEV